MYIAYIPMYMGIYAYHKFFQFKMVAMVIGMGEKCGHGSKIVYFGIIKVQTDFYACNPFL